MRGADKKNNQVDFGTVFYALTYGVICLLIRLRPPRRLCAWKWHLQKNDAAIFSVANLVNLKATTPSIFVINRLTYTYMQQKWYRWKVERMFLLYVSIDIQIYFVSGQKKAVENWYV